MGRKRKSRAPVKIARSPKQVKCDPSVLKQEQVNEENDNDAELVIAEESPSAVDVSPRSPNAVPSQNEPDANTKEHPETEPADGEKPWSSTRVRQWAIEQQQQKEHTDSATEPEAIENPAEEPLEEEGYPMADEASQLIGSEAPLRQRLKDYTEKEILNSVMYECEWFKCGFETTEDMEYMTHVESHLVEYLRGKRDAKDIPCLWDLCDFKPPNSADLESHLHFHAYHNRMKTHGASLSNIIQIPKCNSDSRRRNCIDMYRITFRCEWEDCEEYYNKAQLFFNHVNNHIQDQFPVDKRSSKEPVQCQWAFCKQTYKRASIGLEHIRRHSTERTIGCYTCGAMFVSRLKYIDHCKRQVEYHNREYPCTQCNKLFATKQLMIDHKNIHNKRFACSLCPMMWPSRKALAYHIRYRHVEEKPFKCLVCDHRAVTSRDLRIHASIHEKGHLKRCKEPGCNAAYKSEISLRKHAFQHKGLPPDIYACHLCRKEYKCGTGLSRHFMVAHKLDREPGYVRFQYRQDIVDDKYRLASYLDAELRSDKATDVDQTDQSASNGDQSLLSTTVESDSTWTSYSIESWRPISGDKIAIRMTPGEVFEKEPKKPRSNAKSRKTKKIKNKKLLKLMNSMPPKTHVVRSGKPKSSAANPSTSKVKVVAPEISKGEPTVASVQADVDKPTDKENATVKRKQTDSTENARTIENEKTSSPEAQRKETILTKPTGVPLIKPRSDESVAIRKAERNATPRKSQKVEDDLITETVGEFTITMSRTDKSMPNDAADEPQQHQPHEAIERKELVIDDIVKFDNIDLVQQYLKPDCSVVISIDETDEAGNIVQNETINTIHYTCRENVDMD